MAVINGKFALLHKDLPTPVLLNLDQLNVKRDSTNASDKVSEIKSQPMDDPWSMLSNGNGKLDSDGMRSVPTTISNRNKSRLDVINGHGMNRSRSMDHNARKATAPTTTLPSRSAAESINDTTEFQNGGTSTNVLSKGPTESYQWFLDLDLVKVTMAPEKEGFIFKHINYVVESQLRSSKVLRRYSDFYWLWETLLKRYPMRVIPNLPPKKLGGSMYLSMLCKTRFALTTAICIQRTITFWTGGKKGWCDLSIASSVIRF